MMKKRKHASKARNSLMARMATFLGLREKRSMPRSQKGSRHRAAEAGNVFFTLFGAVAVVGVLGAGIMSTMRGPLTTMVEVNRIEETKAQLRLNARLILVDAVDGASAPYCGANDDDAVTSGSLEFVEPVGFATPGGPTGGGTLPSVGGTITDPWGRTYGYCAYNKGADASTSCAGGNNYIAGDSNTNSPVIVIMSSGPDRQFQTSCAQASANNRQGDDIIEPMTYNEAVSGSGGLWTATSPTEAAINRNLDIDGQVDIQGTSTFQGAGTFQSNVTLSTAGSVLSSPILEGDILRAVGAGTTVSVLDNLDIQGTIINGGGDVTVNDAFVVSGTNTTTLNGATTIGGTTTLNGTVDINNNVDISGDIVNTNGTDPVSINDALDVTGGIDVSGDITDSSDGIVTVNNNLSITGQIVSDVTITGTTNDGSTNVLTLNDSSGTPVELLSVDTLGKVTINSVDTTATTSALTISGATDNGTTDVLTLFDSAGTPVEVFAVDTNGNVSINGGIEINGGTSGQILVANGSNQFVPATMSGDVAIASGGATTIQDNAITNAKMADNSVDTAEIAAGAVDTNELADDAVTNVKIATTGGSDNQCLRIDGTDVIWEDCTAGGTGDGVGTDGLTAVLTNSGDGGNRDITNVNDIDVDRLAVGGTAWSDGSGSGGQALEVDITGDIGAVNYCDENGLNCFTASSVANATSDRIEDRVGTSTIVDTFIDVDTTDDGNTDSIVFTTNNVQRMELQADGDLAVDTNTLFVDATDNEVGIGNASPSADLHIGDRSTTVRLRLDGVDGNATSSAILFNDNGANLTELGYDSGTNAGLYVIGAYNGPTPVVKIQNNGAISLGIDNPDPSAMLDIASTTRGFLPPRLNTAEVTTLTALPPATGLVIFNEDAGDAGILQFWDGTQWVDVGGGGAATGGLWAPDGTNDYIEYDDTLGGVRIGRVTGQPAPATDWLLDVTNSVVYTTANQVGINSSTISAGLELDVTGNVGATQYCDADGGQCFTAADIATLSGGGAPDSDRIEDSAGADTFIDVDTTDDGATNSIVFTNAGTETMRIRADGNIGMGNVDPVSDLHLHEGTGFASMRFTNDAAGTSSTDGIELSYGGNEFSIWMHENEPIRIGTNTTTRMFITADGNITIGNNTTPQTRLDVAGTIRIGDGSELCNIAGHEGGLRYVAASDVYQVCANSATGWEDLFTGGSGAAGLWTDLGGDRIHYGSAGTEQVGIGTNNPLTTLDVNGGIRVGSVAGAAPNYLTIDGLSDVDAGSPLNGQILQYNNVSGNWENVTPASVVSATDLDDINDVSVASPTDGQCLVYDLATTTWEAGPCAAAGSLALNDLSDVTATGATAGQVIKFDGTNWVLGDDLGGDLLFNGNLVFNANSYGNWATDGNSGGPGSSGGYQPVTHLTATRIVHGTRPSGNATVTTYDFDGTDWVQVGNAYAFTGGGMYYNTITAMDSTTIAIENGGEIRTMSFDGTDWSLVGTGETVVGGYATLLQALDSNTVAALSRNGELEVFTWNGSTWTKQGATLVVGPSAADSSDFAALDNNTVAVARADTDTIITYDWNGSTWSQVGNTFTSPVDIDTGSTMANLSSNMIAVSFDSTNTLRTYIWDGSDWTLEGEDLTTAAFGLTGFSGVDETTFVKTSEGNGFQQYTRTSGTATIVDNDAGGALGGLFAVGNRLRVTGSSTNDGIYSVSGIPDSDTLQISETLFAAGPEAAQLSLIDSASTLDSLVDVDVSSALDGNLLSYDNATGTWVPVPSASSADTLSGLTCNENELVRWDGLAWVCSAETNVNETLSLQFTPSTSATVTYTDTTNSSSAAFNAGDMQVAFLNATTMATTYVDGGTTYIATYTLSGSTWSEVPGSETTVCAGSCIVHTTSSISSNTIIFSNREGLTNGVQAWRWNGTSWSSVDTAPNSGYGPAVVLDSSTVVHLRNNDTLYRYSWNGTSFTETDSQVITVDNVWHMVHLDSDTIVFIEPDYSGGTDRLRVFDWNGSDWVENGSGYDLPIDFGGYGYAFFRVTSNLVSLGNGNDLRSYYWNGSSWNPTGIETIGFGVTDGSMLDSDTILLSANGSDTFNEFDVSISVANSQIVDTGATGELDTLLNVNDRFLISRTNSNNRVFTVNNIPNVNTVEVQETVITEGPVDADITVLTDIPNGLDDLSDVNLSIVNDDDCLVYNATNNEWEAGSCAAVGAVDLNDLGDVNAAGATSGQVIKFDGTNWVLGDDLGGDLLFSGDIVFNATSYGNWTPDGNRTVIDGGLGSGFQSLTYMTTDRVASSTGTGANVYLGMYEFDGTDWSLVGNTFDIGNYPGGQSMASLNATDVAVMRSSRIHTYRFDGTNWSLVGTSSAVIGGDTKLSGLDGSSVISLTPGGELRKFNWNGSSWVQDGATLDISGTNYDTYVAGLDSNTIAVMFNAADEIRTYDFNGSNWVQVGNTFTAAVDLTSSIAKLTTNMIAVRSTASGGFVRTYIWDGSDWTLESSDLTSITTEPGGPAMTSNGDDTLIVHLNPNLGLQKYTRTTSNGSIADNGAGGTLGGLFGINNRIRVTGSTNNDGIYTITGILDSDTLQVSESVSTEGPVAAQLSLLDSATSLQSLVDVNVPAPSDGDVLSYDNVTGTWVATPSATSADTLAGLSCNENEIARWNGGSWVCSSETDVDGTFDLQFTATGVSGGTWSAVGSTSNFGFDSNFNLGFTFLDSTTMAMAYIPQSGGNTQLTTFTLSAGTWTQVSGSTLDLGSGMGDIDMDTVANDTVIFSNAGGGTNGVRAYRWNGTTWSVADTAPNGSYGVAKALTPNLVAHYNESNSNMYTYSWNGTSFTQIGVQNIATPGHVSRLPVLDNDTLVIQETDYSGSTDRISVWDWNGSTWTQVGSYYDLPIDIPQFTTATFTVSSNVVAFSNGNTIHTYSWDGTTWAASGSTDIGWAADDMHMVDADTAWAIRSNDEIRSFDFSATVAASQIVDTNATGQLDVLLNNGDRFLVSRTASNNQVFTVTNIPNADTIQVAELAVTEGPVNGDISVLTEIPNGLGDLSDVNTAFANDGDTITYDNTTGTWIATASASSADTLAGLSCTNGQIARYNGTTWECLNLPGTDAGINLQFTAGSVSSGTWAQAGNALGLVISNSDVLSITQLTSTSVAIAYSDNGGNDFLAKYDFDGTDWTLDGAALALPATPFSIFIDALDSTTIAMSRNEEVRTYSFNGSAWAQVGNTLTAPGFNYGTSIAALDNNSVVIPRRDDDTWNVYDWDGTDWTLNTAFATALNVDDSDEINTMDSNTIVYFNGAAGTIQVYDWTGGAFVAVGNALTAQTFARDVTVLNGNLIVRINTNNVGGDGFMQAYSWDGTDFTTAGSPTANISGSSRLAALDNNTVAYIDNQTDQIRTYDFTASTNAGTMADPDTTGVLGALLDNGDRFRVTNTILNNRIFTVGNVNDANTIELVEAPLTEGPILGNIEVLSQQYALTDLIDVTTPSPSDGQCLIYNNGSGEWEAGDCDPNGNTQEWTDDGSGNITNTDNGNVGIGVATPVVKFEVDGSIKIADGGETCDGTTEGALRYNSGSTRVDFCDGADWQPVAIATTQALLVINPPNTINMDISTSGNPAYGAYETLTVTNVGGTTSQTLGTAFSGANPASFEIGTDTCTGNTLAAGGTCTIDVRPLAFGDGSYSATLTVTGNNAPVATLSGTASASCGTIGTVQDGGMLASCTTDYRLIITPQGCDLTDFTEPTCSGADTDQLPYSSQGQIASRVDTGAEPDSYLKNFNVLSALNNSDETQEAVHYCNSLIYNGYTDWYLPSESELANMFPNVTDLDFASAVYWSIDQGSNVNTRGVNMATGAGNGYTVSSTERVRCVRRQGDETIGAKLVADVPGFKWEINTIGNPAQSSIETVQITNIGNANSGAINTFLTGAGQGFVVVSDTCNTVDLAPAATCEIQVRASSSNDGIFSEAVTLDAPNAKVAISLQAEFEGVCNGATFGDIIGGGLFVGCIDGYELIVSASRCVADPANPACTGLATDNILAASSTEAVNIPGADSLTDGLQNTADIMARVAVAGVGTYPAPEYCDAFDFNGFQDWYLPARGELQLIERLSAAGQVPQINGAPFYFQSDNYISSSERSSTELWAPQMNNSSDLSDEAWTSGSPERYRCFRRNGLAPIGASLSISPTPRTDMDVIGPGSPANGSYITFTVTNVGGATSDIIATSLSNTTNFEFGTDNCDANTLTAGSSCQILVRAIATGDGAYAGALNITANNNPTATMSGTATGFGAPVGSVWTGNGSGGVHPTTITDDVGIGTTTPANELDVVGDVRSNSVILNGDAGNAPTYVAPTLALDNLSNVVAPTPTTNQVLQWDGTNWVAGAAPGGGSAALLEDADPDTSIAVDTAGDGTANTIVFTNNSNETMRVTASGNVGIGTATPANELQVAGNVRVDNSLILGLTTGDAPNYIGAPTLNLNDLGNVNVPTPGPNEVLTWTGSAWEAAAASGGGLWTQNAADIYFGTGNVGIGGDTTPDAELDIDSTAPSLHLTDNDAADNGNTSATINLRNSINQDHGRIGFNNNRTLSISNLIDNGNADISISTEDDITFSTGDPSAERMRIDGGGNIGIGTTTPSSALDVTGDIEVSNFLKFNGVAGDAPTYTTPGIALNDISNVSAASPSTNDVLSWNGTNWASSSNVWVPNGGDISYTSGSVGIGGLPGVGYELDVTGDLNVSGTTTNVSDRRMKEDIEILDTQNMAERLMQVNTYQYRKISDQDAKIEYGVIAQELEAIFPDLVHTQPDEMGSKAVNYMGLLAPMIEATKALKAENEALKAELTAMKAGQSDIQASLASLQDDMQGLKAHTGYGIEKASAWALMLLLGMLSGAGIMMVFARRRESSNIDA